MNVYYEESINGHVSKIEDAYHNEEQVISNKLNDVLRIVRNIDQRLKNHFEPPCTPIKEEKKSFILSYDLHGSRSMPSDSNCTSRDAPLPLPLRQKAYINTAQQLSPISPSIIRPIVQPDGSLTISFNQCQEVLRKLSKVKDFIGSEFDEEHIDREMSVDKLFSIIRIFRLPTKRLHRGKALK